MEGYSLEQNTTQQTSGRGLLPSCSGRIQPRIEHNPSNLWQRATSCSGRTQPRIEYNPTNKTQKPMFGFRPRCCPKVPATTPARWRKVRLWAALHVGRRTTATWTLPWKPRSSASVPLPSAAATTTPTLATAQTLSTSSATKVRRQGLDELLYGAGIAQWVVCWARCPAWCSVAGSTFLWASSRGGFPVELAQVLTPFPRNSFGWEYKPRCSLCTHAFQYTDSKDPDTDVLDRWTPAAEHEDIKWLLL